MHKLEPILEPIRYLEQDESGLAWHVEEWYLPWKPVSTCLILLAGREKYEARRKVAIDMAKSRTASTESRSWKT